MSRKYRTIKIVYPLMLKTVASLTKNGIIWQRMAAENKGNQRRMKQLAGIRAILDRGDKPPVRRFDAYAVMFGREWCLTTMPHEMFSQYELWIDNNAPFKRTMTFAFTNGYQGYIAVDETLRLGPKGGYEAASLPNWGGQVWTKHFGPPAIGAEKIIRDNAQIIPTFSIQPCFPSSRNICLSDLVSVSDTEQTFQLNGCCLTECTSGRW